MMRGSIEYRFRLLSQLNRLAVLSTPGQSIGQAVLAPCINHSIVSLAGILTFHRSRFDDFLHITDS